MIKHSREDESESACSLVAIKQLEIQRDLKTMQDHCACEEFNEENY